MKSFEGSKPKPNPLSFSVTAVSSFLTFEDNVATFLSSVLNFHQMNQRHQILGRLVQIVQIEVVSDPTQKPEGKEA